jgi:hypothetical protein
MPAAIRRAPALAMSAAFDRSLTLALVCGRRKPAHDGDER